MVGNDPYFVEWNEQFVSQERGNRVVHYYLKDSNGESILAIVGTERSVRHMFYVVAEEFVRAYGAQNSIHAGFKWRSRREVVDWLTSMLSKQHLQGDLSKSQDDMALDYPESAINVFSSQQKQIRLSKNFFARNSDIVWSGIAWRCGKKLRHYPAFCRNGITIGVSSFVFVMAKGENHYIAYLEDMYEDKRGQRKVKVRWFHHNQEVKGVVPLRNHHLKEVFITPHSQVISTECIDGPAGVLTREHYDKCLAVFPESYLAKVHLCSRQIRNNRVKPFDVSKLRGYFEQPILSCMNSNSFREPDFISRSLTDEEDDGLSSEEKTVLGAKRTRIDRGWQTVGKERPGVKFSGRQCEMMNLEPGYKNLKYGDETLLSLMHVECRPWYNPVFKVDDKIELLCQDSGIRGCWFRCTVLHVSRKQMKVRYDDVQDEDSHGNLEEWIPTFKLAMPDKLGMRCTCRPTIRPTPPNEQVDLVIKIGVAVDAWWSDGWWEGVVTGVDNSADNNLRVYFPGMICAKGVSSLCLVCSSRYNELVPSTLKERPFDSANLIV
ncbi:putative DNA binding protein [Tripterygium wilfordii]|uniref:Putative DNA binding protein n=1 Tax=Tripterygium wilfordii TaxID=458696 RepID=A0A7J7C2T1_TRIWF|nr:putative DNA binding protein [Tripterygium wilfordii]